MSLGFCRNGVPGLKGNDDYCTLSGRARRGGVPGCARRRVRQPRHGAGAGRRSLTGPQHDRGTVGHGQRPGPDSTGHNATGRAGIGAALPKVTRGGSPFTPI